MIKNGTYQYELTERLSFTRYGGTAEEDRAADILLEEIEKLGGKGEKMEFSVPAYEILHCAARVSAPFEMELACAAYGRSGSLPEGGVDLKIFYAEDGKEENYWGHDDLSGYAVIINELSPEAYKLLALRHASAFITVSGKWFDSEANADLISRTLRPHHIAHGRIPGFVMWASDITELLRHGAETIHLELVAREFENTSRNILAEIPGTDKAEEVAVITAHYDSVTVGTGSWDNASGSATAMWLYKHFLENPPRRTLRFIWCGSEEQGLLGSKAYVQQYEAELENIKFCFNFDMCGTVLGSNHIFVTGTDELKTLVEQYCREQGFPAKVDKTVHSSDSAPFADHGVPGVGISRGTRTAEIHTRNDLLFPLSAESFALTADFAAGFVGRVVNSVRLPVDTGMPDDMKEALDKYFRREKK